MKRIASGFVSATVPAVLCAAALAQPPTRDERDRSVGGAMTLAQLAAEPITFELDVAYAATGNPRHRLDIYLPRQRRATQLPVVAFFHGGGWLQGDKSDGAARLMPLVREGRYAGVSVGYRLSGEARWPAQIHDCKAAIRWIRANAGRYGLDADRIGVWGRSAGGHLALMLGVSGDVPGLEGDLGEHRNVGSRVQAVVNFFGVSELLAIAGEPSDIDRRRPDAPEALLIGGGLSENPDKAKAASPVTYVSEGDAPVLTVHGTLDRTVPYDQAVRMNAALSRARVPSFFVTIDGAGHGDFGSAADGRVVTFFAMYLRGESARVSTAPIDFAPR